MRLFFRFLLCSCFPFLGWSQPASNLSTLEIADIMQGERFVGFLPERIQWHPNSREIFFTWNPEQATLRSLYAVQLSGEKPAPVSPERQQGLPEQGVYNTDHSLMAYAKSGDLFLYDAVADSSRQLTFTRQRESGPSFSSDDQRVIFTIDDNLFAWHLKLQRLEQLTYFEKGTARSATTGRRARPMVREPANGAL